jgi:hypothetical protein
VFDPSRRGLSFYVSGPYDDPRSVVGTLEQTVGRGNFEVLVIDAE